MPETSEWWRDAAIYQVYLRSFADGNGDGVGERHGCLHGIQHLIGSLPL